MGKITNTFYKLLPRGVQRNIRKRYYLKRFAAVTNRDEKEMQAIGQFVKAGAVVADIGANFGAYTKILSEYAGAEGKVFSFEPIPDTFAALENNIVKNQYTQTSAFNLGLSDEAGMVNMVIPDYAHGGQNFYEARIDRNSQKGVSIKTVTVDEFLLPQVSRMDFMKIDVEGHEPEVLKGSIQLLKKYSPVLLIEINDDFTQKGSTGKQVVDFLTGLGYRIHYFDGKTLLPASRKQEGVNYFFLPGE